MLSNRLLFMMAMITISLSKSVTNNLKKGYIVDKQIFNEVYSKFYKKDYFFLKAEIQNNIKWAKEKNFKYKISNIKEYLYNMREKSYQSTLERIEERKQGQHFPQREKFTHAIFKTLGI
jgi:hypothetical protein